MPTLDLSKFPLPTATRTFGSDDKDMITAEEAAVIAEACPEIHRLLPDSQAWENLDDGDYTGVSFGSYIDDMETLEGEAAEAGVTILWAGGILKPVWT